MSTTDGRWLLLVAQSFRGFGTGTRGGGDRGRCGALCGRHCSASIDPTMLAASFAMLPGWLGSECSGVRRAGTDQAPAASSRRSAHLVRSAAQDAIPLPATASLGARGCTAKDGQERLRRGGDAIEPRGQPRGHGRARGREGEADRERQTERERERERQTDRQTGRQRATCQRAGTCTHRPSAAAFTYRCPPLPVVSVREAVCLFRSCGAQSTGQAGGWWCG